MDRDRPKTEFPSLSVLGSVTPEAPALDWEAAKRSGYNPLPVRALQIETTSICNFRCPSCPLSMGDYGRPEKHMSVADFERVLDAFPSVEKLELQGIGEVFLNPCALEIVRAAKRRGLVVATYSNASKIEPDVARELVASGIDLINFSMDGADEPTFRALRKGGTLARYKTCVRNVVAARAAARSAKPEIGMMTVLSKRNVRQVPDMLAIAEDLGMDTVVFTKINASANAEIEAITLGPEEHAWLAAQPPHRGRVKVVWAYLPWTHQERVECYWPRHMAYVTVEGDVTPCCNYYDSREIKLGNAFEKRGEEIWNDEPYRAFRRRLWSGDLPDVCRKC
jgi:radical SAM protein with 4Fe4S-binding SPASM domain